MRPAVRWASEDLSQALAMLTPQQARGVQRIVEAELEGRTLSSLLDCPGQICTSTTYYGSGKRRGWKGKPGFRTALTLARRDYREWMLNNGTGEALILLARTAPEAVRALRQQIVGDRPAIAALEVALQASEPELRINAAKRLGQTGLSVTVPALASALAREQEENVKKALVDALGMVAGARDSDRRTTCFGVLDRAGTETASKLPLGGTGGTGQLGEVTDDEHDAIERALREQAAGDNGQAAGGGEAE